MTQTYSISRPRRDPRRLTRMTGVFRRRSGVVRAVNRLSRKSVPSDAIRVFVHGPDGSRREIPVEEESGAFRGAISGAVVGGLIGLMAVVATILGLFGPVGAEVASLRGVAGTLRAVVGGAAAAVPLGALLGMSHWQGAKRISKADFETGTATVVVESEELAERARLTLHEAGALHVVVE